MTSPSRRQPTWLGKTLAGTFLGLALSFIFVAFFAWYGPGGIDARDKVQFNMWMITPVWLTILVLVIYSTQQSKRGLSLAA